MFWFQNSFSYEELNKCVINNKCFLKLCLDEHRLTQVLIFSRY